MSMTFKSFEELQKAMFGEDEVTSNEEARKDSSVREKVNRFNNQRKTPEFTLSKDEGPADRRAEDDEAERRFDSFLQKNVYPGLIQLGIADKIESVYDTERQCAGSDAIYTVNGQQIKVDNKNRTSVCNKNSRGVPFELFTNNKRGKRIVGWGPDEEKDTDYIKAIHCYVDNSNKKVNFNKISMDDITRVDMFLYKRDDVFRYLATQGHPMSKLLEEAKQFESEFVDKYKGMSLKDIPDSARRKALGDHEFLFTSYFKFKEDPTVVLIDESVIKMLPNTRHTQWTPEKGVFEISDKVNCRALTPSADKTPRSRDDEYTF